MEFLTEQPFFPELQDTFQQEQRHTQSILFLVFPSNVGTAAKTYTPMAVSLTKLNGSTVQSKPGEYPECNQPQIYLIQTSGSANN